VSYAGRLHFLNVQYEDYLLGDKNGASAGKYLCVVFNPFLRTSADGDDQRIGTAERPGSAALSYSSLCTSVFNPFAADPVKALHFAILV